MLPAHTGWLAALPASLMSFSINKIEQDDPELPAFMSALSSKQLPAMLRRFRICSLYVREGLDLVPAEELASELCSLKRRIRSSPVNYRLRHLAEDMLACAVVCPDCAIQGMY